MANPHDGPTYLIFRPDHRKRAAARRASTSAAGFPSRRGGIGPPRSGPLTVFVSSRHSAPIGPADGSADMNIFPRSDEHLRQVVNDRRFPAPLGPSTLTNKPFSWLEKGRSLTFAPSG